MGAALVDATRKWVEEPIIGDVSTVDLFLVVLVVLAAIILWTRVLAHLGAAFE